MIQFSIQPPELVFEKPAHQRIAFQEKGRGLRFLFREGFTGLDGETLAVVLEETRALLAGRTCVLVTHRPEEAEALGAEIVSL